MEHWQTVINLVVGASLTAIGWFCREIWDSVKSLKEDVHKIEIQLPENYMKKSEEEVKLDKIDARFDKLDKLMEKVFDKLENFPHK